MPDAVKGPLGRACITPGLLGIALGPGSIRSDSPFGMHYRTGIRKETVEGLTDAPCLAIEFLTFWRFRWAVDAGVRTISIYAKQPINQTPYPKVIIKANPEVGLNADAEGSAAAGSGWKQITVSFVATAAGVVWVEMHNAYWPAAAICYFDLVTTS